MAFINAFVCIVSILVFLELALGRSDGGALNSYPTFQSLFSWNLPSDARWQDRRNITMFQSLFSWNLPSDANSIGHLRNRYQVSILVFLELALGLER